MHAKHRYNFYYYENRKNWKRESSSFYVLVAMQEYLINTNLSQVINNKCEFLLSAELNHPQSLFNTQRDRHRLF